MADIGRLTLTIEPESTGTSAVRLETFIAGLENVRRALTRYDRNATEQSKPSTAYDVVALSLNSPATVTLEPRVTNQSFDARERVIRGFLEGAHMIEEGGGVPPTFDRGVLEILKETAEQARTQAIHMRLQGGPYSVAFDVQMERRVERFLAEEEGVYGSVEGVLERVNFHAGANACTVFPLYGSDRVNCTFPNEMRDAVNDAVLKHVRVTGMVWSDARSPFPHRVDIDRIEQLTEVGGRPSLSSLRGLMPDLLGGLTAEEYIIASRDGWA